MRARRSYGKRRHSSYGRKKHGGYRHGKVKRTYYVSRGGIRL
jgi:hypothetical protein